MIHLSVGNLQLPIRQKNLPSLRPLHMLPRLLLRELPIPPHCLLLRLGTIAGAGS
jgi:hypothetical protein